jgi:segregation and condensation protein B
MSLKAKLEAVVYAAEEPVTLAQFAAIFSEEVLQGLGEPVPQEPAAEQIALVVPVSYGEAPALEDTPAEATEGDDKKLARVRDRRVRQVLQGVLDELIADYANGERGMEIREIAGGYRMATKPEYHDAVRGFVKSLKPPMKLSLQALETLAVIAYKQPVTAPEVSEIRGVDSGGVLGGLVSRKLITTAGRKPVIGRPILYKTTKEFLLRFGLKDVNDLPSMEEFEKMAGELAESEAAGEAQDVDLQSSEAMHSGESGGAAPVEAAEEEVPVQVEEETHAEGQTEAEEPVPAAETSEEPTAEHQEQAPELTSNSVTGES